MGSFQITTLFAFILAIYSAIIVAEAVIPTNQTTYQCGPMRTNGTTGWGVKEFSVQFIGHDYNGLPILRQPWGKWDALWLVDHVEKMETFERNYEQLIEDILQGGFFSRFSNDSDLIHSNSHMSILDFEGFNMKQTISHKVLRLLMRIFTKNQQFQGAIEYGFIINANPLVHQVINMAKPIVGSMLERFDVYGVNSKRWIPQLLKKIPFDTLSRVYGGDNKDLAKVISCQMI